VLLNDACLILGICYEDALALIKYSGVKYVKIGKMYRVEEKEFKQLMDKGEINIHRMVG